MGNLVVIQLDCTATGETGNSATVSSTATTQPFIPPQTRAPVCSPPAARTPIAKLQEYCQQNSLDLPVYKEAQAAGGFRCTVKVRSKQFTGEIRGAKQDAKHSAAEVALQQLDRSSKCLLP